MIRELLLGILLAICAAEDQKTGRLRLSVLAIFAAAGIACFIILQPFGLWEGLSGLMIGLLFAALSLITEGKIGMGDAFLIAVAGIYLGGWESAALTMGALFLSALFGVVRIIQKKADRHTEMPFVPFMLASFLVTRFI